MIEKQAFDKGYRLDSSGIPYGLSGNKLSIYTDRRGYKSFNIRTEKGVRRVMIHRFQAFLSHGESIYKKGTHVRHLNGDSGDNSNDNISIGTASDNMMDIPLNVRIKKSERANKKYSNEMVREIRALNNNGFSYKQIMKMFDISSLGTVSHIINKRLCL